MQQQTDFQKEFREAMEAVMYPKESIAPAFVQLLPLALSFETPKTIECSWDMFKALLTWDGESDLNLHQISFAINSVTFRSIQELQLTVEDYIEAGNQMMNMTKVWNDLIQPIRNTLKRKQEAMQRIATPGGNGKIRQIGKA